MTDVPYLTNPFTGSAQVPPPAAGAPLSREEAFHLLRDVVREFEETGRRAFSAGVKPAMQRKSQQRFDESSLGYQTFREFLDAAIEEHVVDGQPEGPHLLLHVPGVILKPAVARKARSGRPVPPDLWAAFVDWDQGKRRAYDKNTGRAVIFSAEPADGEAQEDTVLRGLVKDEPERFIEIRPITFETQLGWMREYAESLANPSDRRMLLPLLEHDPRPVNAFNLFLRRNPGLEAAWKQRKVERVKAAISDWMREHQIDPSVLNAAKADLGVRPDGSEERFERPERLGQLDTEMLRRRIVAAVQRMPLADLLRLPIPVEYMVDPE